MRRGTMALTGDKRAEFDTVTAKYIFVKNGAGDYVVSLGAAVLAWLLRELSMMSSGQAYVSIAWDVYGVHPPHCRIAFESPSTQCYGHWHSLAGRRQAASR